MRFNGPAAKRILEDREITISAAARACGVDRAHFSNILAGRRGAGAELVKAFADFVGVQPFAIVGPEDPRAALAELAEVYGYELVKVA